MQSSRFQRTTARFATGRPVHDPRLSAMTGDDGEFEQAGNGAAQSTRTDLSSHQPAAETAAADGYTRAAADGRGRRKKKAGWLKVTLLTLLSMILVIVLAFVGFALYLNHVISANITHGAPLPTATVKPAADAGDAQNILLIGSDTRSDSVTNNRAGARSDVIQLVHISAGEKSVQVIHFPRDLYVSIPGHGKNKINAAFAYGGPALLAQTLSDLLGGVTVNRYAIIDFKGFADLTNDLGGVNVYVAQPFTEPGYGTFHKGYNTMNGAQALGFVRERHQLAEGDIDRGRDQQAWISAVIRKTLSAGTLFNPLKLTRTVSDLTRYTEVDANTSAGDLRGLAFSLRNLRSGDITYYTAPFTGFANNPVAGSIDVVNVPQMKKLGEALYHDKMAGYTNGQNSIH